VVVEILDHLFDRMANLKLLVVRELAMRRIGLGQRKRRHGNRIIAGREALFLELPFRHIGCLGVVGSKEALIEAFMRFECRFVSQQHIDELQCFDVFAEDNKANRQRRRKKQSDWTSQQCPEERRDDDGYRRQPGVLTVKQGSMTCPAVGSATRNKPAVAIAMLHPGSTAAASAMGKNAAMMLPMKGTKRIRPAKIAQRTALGTPITHSPMVMTSPKPALRRVCMRKKEPAK
jgi:hypothetical protein